MVRVVRIYKTVILIVKVTYINQSSGARIQKEAELKGIHPKERKVMNNVIVINLGDDELTANNI